MRARAAWMAAGVLAAGAAAWLALRTPDEMSVGPARGNAPARVSAPPAPGATSVAPAFAGLPPLPGSLGGSQPDGALVVDAEGRFVATRDALDLFDYFFAASGEEPDASIRARIEALIRERLADPTPALELFAQYLAYREAARALFVDENGAALPLERRLQRIRELRDAHFGALADTFFAEEEQRWRVDIERLHVLRDTGLTEDERDARLAALEAERPPAEREARDAASAAFQLRQDETDLRAEGASDAEIGALREARFGPEAAARLAALDQQRAAWAARVAAYRAEREKIVAREPADAEERAAAIAALRAARFTETERIRVEALDRQEARSAAIPPSP